MLWIRGTNRWTWYSSSIRLINLSLSLADSVVGLSFDPHEVLHSASTCIWTCFTWLWVSTIALYQFTYQVPGTGCWRYDLHEEFLLKVNNILLISFKQSVRNSPKFSVLYTTSFSDLQKGREKYSNGKSVRVLVSLTASKWNPRYSPKVAEFFINGPASLTLTSMGSLLWNSTGATPGT